VKSLTNTPSESNRIIGLDILRSFAILLVLLQHGQFIVHDSKITRYYTQLFNLLDGVSIFFVLSGFLIGKIIINQFITNSTSIKTLYYFWLKRWLRTLPNYFLILLIFAILYNSNSSLDFLNIPKSYYFFLQNTQVNEIVNFKESWSLSVEEWFYFSFPLVLFLGLKIGSKKYSKLIFVLVLMAYLIIPLFLRLQIQYFDINFDFRKIVIYRLDAIIYGVLAAYISTYFQEIWSKNKITFLFFGILIFVLIILNPANWKVVYSPIYYSIESIGIVLFFPFFASLENLKWTSVNSFFKFISSISYSLYLVNLTLVQMVCLPYINQVFKSSDFSKSSSELMLYTLFWIISISISTLLYYAFERPILNWRNRIISE
jgi:peptidoglycan/LPS O-acetylase OafA/YrhL